MIPEAHHDLVLVGGGHSHALVLRHLAMRPQPSLRLTLISPDSLTAYSGMLPGLVAGCYDTAGTHIDLSRLCAAARARWLPQQVTALDPLHCRVQLDNGDEVEYDTLSLDVGATPDLDSVPGARAHAIAVKPVANFQDRWRLLLAELDQRLPRQRRIAVVGGGAGGTEIAAALAHSLGSRGQVSLITAGALLAGYPQRAQTLMRRRLTDRLNIRIHEHSPILRVDRQRLHCADQELAFDLLFWCTGVKAPPWLAASGLPCDENGFLRVDGTLTSPADARVHAAGDCAAFPLPLAKAGVYAVRQAPVLAANLIAAAKGTKKRQYHPQKQFLSLLSAGPDYAVASRGRLPALGGAWVWRWKDRIDRAFIRRFQQLPGTMQPSGNQADEPAPMHCAGCGAKVGGQALSEALATLNPQLRPEIECGLAQGDDAAVIRWPAGHRLVQSVDYFPAFIDEPYLFGRVAALHSLSDVFAMNAQPHSALATLCLQRHHPRLQGRDLRRLMTGAVRELNQAGCTLVGGHTIEGPELAAGFTINGLSGSQPWHKSGAHPGDVLILTKPLGIGIQLAAWARQAHRGPWLDATLATMLQSNGPAREALAELPPHACTDITGFGLLGHLLELCRHSGVDAWIQADALPLLPGTQTLVRQGIHSSLRPVNDQVLSHCPQVSRWLDSPALVAATDPQTSGGLLFALAAEQQHDVLAALSTAGIQAVVIGGTHVKNHKADITITVR